MQGGPGCPAPLTSGSFFQITSRAPAPSWSLPRVAGAGERSPQPAAAFPRSHHRREPLAFRGRPPGTGIGTGGAPFPVTGGMRRLWAEAGVGDFCPSPQGCAFPLETISNKREKCNLGGQVFITGFALQRSGCTQAGTAFIFQAAHTVPLLFEEAFHAATGKKKILKT